MATGIMMMIFLTALRVAADVAPSLFQNRNSQKNKRPLFDGISFAGSSIRSPRFSLLVSLQRVQRLG
jgi:hypothetical protein